MQAPLGIFNCSACTPSGVRYLESRTAVHTFTRSHTARAGGELDGLTGAVGVGREFEPLEHLLLDLLEGPPLGLGDKAG